MSTKLPSTFQVKAIWRAPADGPELYVNGRRLIGWRREDASTYTSPDGKPWHWETLNHHNDRDEEGISIFVAIGTLTRENPS